MPGSSAQRDALFCKTPFVSLLLSSSRGKQKTQEEEVDKPAGGAEGKVRVAETPAFVSLEFYECDRHTSLPCPSVFVYHMWANSFPGRVFLITFWQCNQV